MIRTTFWGVRGSIPTPGPHTAEIGGNTSCVEVQAGDVHIVFDGGTGLRSLGAKLAKAGPHTVHLFFSHVHWDHIQGFPFFAPAFIPGNVIHMYGATSSQGTIEHAMAGQMEFPNFPVKLEDLGSELVFHEMRADVELTLGDDVRVRAAAGSHPGGVLAYRVDHGNRAVVYVTDTEHEGDTIDPGLLALARGADVLIYDSMYTPEEYIGDADGRSRVGWGHSTFVQGAALAEAAGVEHYVLFHHDPDQDDAAVRDKERRARALFPGAVAAYEGLTIELD